MVAAWDPLPLLLPAPELPSRFHVPPAHSGPPQPLPKCFLRKRGKTCVEQAWGLQPSTSPAHLAPGPEAESGPAFLPRTPASEGTGDAGLTAWGCPAPSSPLSLPWDAQLSPEGGCWTRAPAIHRSGSRSRLGAFWSIPGSPDEQRHCGHTGLCSMSASATRPRQSKSLKFSFFYTTSFPLVFLLRINKFWGALGGRSRLSV